MSSPTPSMSSHSESSSTASWLVLAAAVALASPALFLRYLPMTDMPQHLAVTAMLLQLDDPAFGFADYYRAPDGFLARAIPFGVQYAVLCGLGRVASLEIAFRIFVGRLLALREMMVLICAHFNSRHSVALRSCVFIL